MYNNILIFNPSFLGDSVLTTPLIKAVQYYYPNANIHFCVRPEYVSLFENTRYLTSVIGYDKRGKYRGIGGIFRFVEILRKVDPDLIISPHKSFRSTMVANFTGARKTVGFRQAALRFMYDDVIDRNMGIHEVERNLMLLKPVIDNFDFEHVKKVAGKPDTFLNESIQTEIIQRINDQANGKPLIGIAPASVWPTKMWPETHYAELITTLNNAGYQTVLFAAKNEQHIVNTILHHTEASVINMATDLSLPELVAAIKSMELLVTNDSGPLHIAVSQSTPVVAIFGPTVQSLGFTPYDNVSTIVENIELDCRPCGLHGSKNCPEKHFKCMLDIRPAEVYDAVLKTLENAT